MLESSGFGDEIAAFDDGMAAGDVERAKAGLSDGMLGELAGIGGKEDVHGAVRRYQDAGDVPRRRRRARDRLRRHPGGGRRPPLERQLRAQRWAPTSARSAKPPRGGNSPSWRASWEKS